MTMDNCANAMWWAGARFNSSLLQPALSLIELHHTKLNDIWDWTDITHGPEGESCSGGSPAAPTGRDLAGNPELNGQYTRQLQVSLSLSLSLSLCVCVCVCVCVCGSMALWLCGSVAL